MSAATATNAPWHASRRLRLALDVNALELPEHLDQPDEPTDDRKQRANDQCPGRRAKATVDQPASERAACDRPREVEADGLVASSADDGIGCSQSAGRQHATRRTAEVLDVRLAVREGEEHRLELRGRQVDPFLQHPPE